MKSIIRLLDKNDVEIKLKDIQFSDNAQHFQILEDISLREQPFKIYVDGSSSSLDVTKLFILKTALDSISNDIAVNVYMPYLPYAREDRSCTDGQSYSLSFFAKAFNLSFPSSKLVVLDAHNKESLKLFNNAISFDLSKAISSESGMMSLLGKEGTGLICPDNGAIPRTEDIAFKINKKPLEQVIVYCNKKRNMSTGRIISFSASEVKQDFSDLVLFDDICDGGGTFIASAIEIRKQLPNVNLHLCVSHGIFSKGVELLKREFKTISCFNNLSDENDVVEYENWKTPFLLM